MLWKINKEVAITEVRRQFPPGWRGGADEGGTQDFWDVDGILFLDLACGNVGV